MYKPKIFVGFWEVWCLGFGLLFLYLFCGGGFFFKKLDAFNECYLLFMKSKLELNITIFNSSQRCTMILRLRFYLRCPKTNCRREFTTFEFNP